MKNRKILKTLGIFLTFAIMLMPSVLAADTTEGAAQAGIGEINAITDYSTYGAADIMQTIDTEHADGGYADVKGEPLASRLALLKALGIMKGDNAGNFNPDNNITRAEFITTVLRMMNGDYEEPTGQIFYDIDESNIFNKEIYNGYKLGLIVGYNDGTFRPNNTVSASEAIAMVLRVMGYGAFCEGNGGYPMGYLQQATRLKILNGVNASYTDAMTRKDAGTLIYNCLHTDVMEVTSITNGNTSYGKQDTALYEFFNIYYDTGIVRATDLSGIGSDEAVAKGNVKIDADVFACSVSNIYNLLGYEVKYYVKENEKRDEVFYTQKTDSNYELMVRADDIISFENYVLTYREDGGRTRTARVTADHDLIYNNIRKIRYTEEDFKPRNGFIKLVSSAGDKNYSTVFVNEFFNLYVDSLKIDDSTLTIVPGFDATILQFNMEDVTFELYDSAGKIDIGALSVSTSYDADGNAIKVYSLPPIPTNTLISVFADKISKNGKHYVADKDASYIRIYINDANFEGYITSMAEENGEISEVTVGKTSFDASTDNYFEYYNKQLKISDYGTVWLDFDGKAALIADSKQESDFEYGYLILASVNKKILEAKLMDIKGGIKWYNSAESVKINGTKYIDAKKMYAELEKSAKLLDPTFTISQIIKYKLNAEGLISQIQTVTAETGIADGYEDDHLNRAAPRADYTAQNYYGFSLYRSFPKKVDGQVKNVLTALYGKPDILFVVPGEETFDENDYTIMKTWAPDETSKTIDIFDLDNNLKPAIVVAYENRASSLLDNPYAIVESITKIVNEDETTGNAIEVISGSGRTVYTENKEGAFKNLKKGDIVALYGYSKEIDAVSVLGNVKDVMNYDMNVDLPDGKSIGENNFTPYEIYSWDSKDRMVVLQYGEETADNKRASQRIIHWTTNTNVLKYGVITVTVDETTGKFTAATGSPNDIRAAKEYGYDKATKMFLGEKGGNGVKFIVLVNKKVN